MEEECRREDEGESLHAAAACEKGSPRAFIEPPLRRCAEHRECPRRDGPRRSGGRAAPRRRKNHFFLGAAGCGRGAAGRTATGRAACGCARTWACG
jgi:hypothetical protein